MLSQTILPVTPDESQAKAGADSGEEIKGLRGGVHRRSAR